MAANVTHAGANDNAFTEGGKNFIDRLGALGSFNYSPLCPLPAGSPTKESFHKSPPAGDLGGEPSSYKQAQIKKNPSSALCGNGDGTYINAPFPAT
jgi:hypothetical protein